MGFETPDAVYYQIRRQHRNAEVREVIPTGYEGVMCTDRGNLLRFLEDPNIEPTNNRAERALRGAVIARKVSHCSKNEGGANARTAFMSVIKTLRKRGPDIMEALEYVMRTGQMPVYDIV